MDGTTRDKTNARLAKRTEEERGEGDRWSSSNHFAAVLRSIKAVPAFKSLGKQITQCTHGRPCNLSACRHCAVTRDVGTNDARPIIDSDVTMGRRMARGGENSFRQVGAKQMCQILAYADQKLVVPVTINMSLVPKGDCGIETIKAAKGRIRRFLKKEFPVAIATGIFDVSAHHGKTTFIDYGKNGLAKEFQTEDRPNCLALNLHIHMFLYVPRFTASQIIAKLRKRFPGSKRVCTGKIMDYSITDSNHEIGGPEGWAEYSAMEKYEVNQDCDDPEQDNVAAVQEIARFRSVTTRSNRFFEFGLKAAKSSQVAHSIAKQQSNQSKGSLQKPGVPGTASQYSFPATTKQTHTTTVPSPVFTNQPYKFQRYAQSWFVNSELHNTCYGCGSIYNWKRHFFKMPSRQKRNLEQQGSGEKYRVLCDCCIDGIQRDREFESHISTVVAASMNGAHNQSNGSSTHPPYRVIDNNKHCDSPNDREFSTKCECDTLVSDEDSNYNRQQPTPRNIPKNSREIRPNYLNAAKVPKHLIYMAHSVWKKTRSLIARWTVKPP